MFSLQVEDLYPTYLEKIDSDMLTGNHRQIWQQVQKDYGKEFSVGSRRSSEEQQMNLLSGKLLTLGALKYRIKIFTHFKFYLTTVNIFWLKFTHV